MVYILSSPEEAGGILEEAGKIEYFCREDALAAAGKLKSEAHPCTTLTARSKRR